MIMIRITIVMKFPLFFFPTRWEFVITIVAGNMTLYNQDGNDSDNDDDNAQV